MTGDAAGHRLNNAPEWSGSVSAVYEFATGRAGTASLRGDVSWQSRVFFTPFNDAIETQPAYGLVHLRAGFEPRSHRWEVAVYARNLGNRGYITGARRRTSASPRSPAVPASRATGARSSRFAAEQTPDVAVSSQAASRSRSIPGNFPPSAKARKLQPNLGISGLPLTRDVTLDPRANARRRSHGT